MQLLRQVPGAAQAQARPPGDEECEPGMKLCRRCGIKKPVKDFYKSKANIDGLDGRCKACDALQCAERRRRKARVEVQP